MNKYQKPEAELVNIFVTNVILSSRGDVEDDGYVVPEVNPGVNIN